MRLRRKFSPFNEAEGPLEREDSKTWTLKPVRYKMAGSTGIGSIVHNSTGLSFRKVTWEISGE